ncbi:unnamed protein product [Pleuronectes platessa]|uniref:Uncharacterized protein n=1 Tax=Pleuronectes platessa TaxID=8262 RepID=A0A9N7ZCL5_PLEPL|nr:unnamed protein product [Pleuronectes platessa]
MDGVITEQGCGTIGGGGSQEEEEEEEGGGGLCQHSAMEAFTSLSFPSFTRAQTASSRPAACLEPRLSRVQTAERSGSTPPLPPLSSMQLGAIIPLLCVSVMGKRAHITTGEELADNYMGWREAKTHSGQISQATTEGTRGGLMRQAWGRGPGDITHRLKLLHLREGACSSPLQDRNSCGRTTATLGKT